MVNEFAVILACTKEGGIGINNRLPWRIPDELKYFKTITTQSPRDKINAVIMGKNTWLSLPKNHRPLKDRLNIIVSQSLTIDSMNVVVVPSLDSAINHVCGLLDVYNAFVIGGHRLYNDAIKHSLFNKAYVTHVYNKSLSTIECDTFIDIQSILTNYKLEENHEVKDHEHLLYKFCVYKR